MVEGETGFTVDPTNHSNYASRIRELLENPQLAAEMGKAARERILEKFSIERVAEENIKFYKRFI